MRRPEEVFSDGACFGVLTGVALLLGAGCGDSGSASTTDPEAGGSSGAENVAGSGGAASGSGGSTANGGSMPNGGTTSGGMPSVGGTGTGVAPMGATTATYDEVARWIADYQAANPGSGGKDWDINAKTPDQVAADPAAQRLLSLCGEGQRPIIPDLAWEYGGGDHQWIDPDASALVYCVYIPTASASEHWQYDSVADHVTADVYVLFPDQNPCADEQGADQVAACIGDRTNFEILVDTASLNDGADAGYNLSEASTELRLILPDGTVVPHLVDNV